MGVLARARVKHAYLNVRSCPLLLREGSKSTPGLLSLLYPALRCHGHSRGSDLEPQIHLRALLCTAVGPERALPLSKARPERVSSRWICLGSASLGVDPCVAIYYGVNIYYGVPAR